MVLPAGVMVDGMAADEFSVLEMSLRRLFWLSVAADQLAGEPEEVRLRIDAGRTEAADQVVRAARDYAAAQHLTGAKILQLFDQVLAAENLRVVDGRDELVNVIDDLLSRRGHDHPADTVAAAALVIGIAVLAASGAAPLGVLIAGGSIFTAMAQAAVTTLVAGILAALITELIRRGRKQRERPTTHQPDVDGSTDLDKLSGQIQETSQEPVSPSPGDPMAASLRALAQGFGSGSVGEVNGPPEVQRALVPLSELPESAGNERGSTPRVPSDVPGASSSPVTAELQVQGIGSAPTSSVRRESTPCCAESAQHGVPT